MTREEGAIPLRWRWAAWGCLAVTLASGTLLRYQWTGHAAIPLNARHLLHGHSHIALLGWAFIGVFGLILRGSRGRSPGIARGVGEALLLLLIALLFVAFVQEGYGPRSIALSTLHIAVSFGLVGAWFARGRTKVGEPARPWIELSLVWFVVGSIGPLMLAFGTRMGEAWIEAWVGYYLLLLFNGWLTFALVGLLAERLRVEPARPARDAMAIGVLPMAFPLFGPWFEPWLGVGGLPWIAFAGALLFGGGVIVVAAQLGRKAPGAGSPSARLLLAGTLAALALSGILHAVGAVPGWAPHLREVRSFVVGLVHLQLLGFVTAGLALLLLPVRQVGVGLLLAGSWAMIGILFWLGALELLGRPVLWPTQWVLTWTGVVALLGGLLLAPGPGGEAG